MGPRSTQGKQAPRVTLMQGFPKLHFEEHDATWTDFAGTEDSLRLKEKALYVDGPSPSSPFAGPVLCGTDHGRTQGPLTGPTGNWVSSRG